jgi:uncharacterized protein with HEPN domain
MLSNSAQIALRDIAYHIALISEFVTGIDFDGFQSDLRTNYAVTRCLEIISEASRRLPDDLKERHSGLAWKQMASAGNVYRHDYEAVDVQQVWETIHHALPVLKIAIDTEITRLLRND